MTALFALVSYKSKNTILYYEYVIYIAIIAIILAVIFIINIARIDKSLIRIISAGCFGITILMLAVYYIIHVLFIIEYFIKGWGLLLPIEYNSFFS